MKRRTFLRNTLVASAALSSGLVAPNLVMADDEPANPFKVGTLEEALKAAGVEGYEETDKVVVTAPDLAENAEVVPVQISSELADVTEIVVFIANNPTPYAAKFTIFEGTDALVKCRFKMGESSDVIGVVKAGGKYYGAKKAVKVTKGGCGG